ncbi:MAG: Bax inhibitor-1/YccA family protein, partial [Actinomycetota bacterium]|nr:Bax inhibitor-1/YccA family protein [Actinomycetota bacterium]
MANPALNKYFGNGGSSATLDASASSVPIQSAIVPDDRMTIGGTAGATGLLLVILMLSSALGWSISSPTGTLPMWSIIMLIGAFVLAIITIFNPRIAVITGPIYTAAQGLFIGSMSKAYETAWGGIVLTAVLATISVFIVMLVLFVTRTIT